MSTENNPTIQFAIEKLRRELKQDPDKAVELAVNYFEDWLTLSTEYQQLQTEYDTALSEIELLTTSLLKTSFDRSKTKVTLPPFLNCHRH